MKVTVRALVLGTAFLLMSSVSAMAQGTLGAGLSLAYPGEDAGQYTGFQVDYSSPIRSMQKTSIGWVGDFSFNHSGENEEDLMLFQGGARVTGISMGKFRPFGQVLMGVGRFSCCEGDFSESNFALTPGGGVDVLVAGKTSVRAQIDFPIIYFEDEAEAGTRLFFGLSWRIGR